MLLRKVDKLPPN